MIEEDPQQGRGEAEASEGLTVQPASEAGAFQRRALRVLRAYPAATLGSLDGHEVLDHTFDPERRAELADLKALLEERLADLPARYGQIVRMRILDGRPPRDVARELGIPTETVRTRTRRGLALLKASVGSRLPNDPLAPRRPFLGILALPWLRPGAEQRSMAGTAACASLGIFALFASWFHGSPQDTAPFGGARAALESSAVAAPPQTERLPLPSAPDSAPATDTPPERDARNFKVSILRPDGSPGAGAALFGFDRLARPGTRLGTADGMGQVEITAPPSARWLAARGSEGEISDAVLLNQTGHTHRGTVSLPLRAVDVTWIRVASPLGGEDAEALTMAARPMDERFAVHVTAHGGVRAVPTSVPAWVRGVAGDRRYGLPWGDVPKRLTIWRKDQLLWTSETYEAFAEPPTQVTIRPTWSLQGRVVSADGVPAPGTQVHIHSPGTTRHTGTELWTGADGSFILEHLSDEAVAISVRGLKSVLVRSPEDGQDDNRIDVGAIALRDAEGESRRQVQVLGAAAGDELCGLRFGAVHAWPGQRLAYPEAKTTAFKGPEFGLYVGPEDLRSFIALALMRADRAPLIALRPNGGWPPGVLTIDARDIPSGTVRGTIPGKMLPARVMYTHLTTGLQLFESVGSAGALGFESRTLPPGLWDVSVHGVDGATSWYRAVDVVHGRAANVGVLEPASGRLELLWPDDLPAGEICSLIYMRGGIPVAFETRTSGEPIRSQDLEPGSYTVHMETRRGTWLAAGQVFSDQSTTARLDGGQHVVGLLIGPMMRRGVPSDATMEFFDSKGALIMAITGSDLPPVGKLHWVIPTRDVTKMRATIGGLVYEAQPIRRRRPERTVFNVLGGRGVTRVR